jgi:hypothetical protein
MSSRTATKIRLVNFVFRSLAGRVEVCNANATHHTGVYRSGVIYLGVSYFKRNWKIASCEIHEAPLCNSALNFCHRGTIRIAKWVIVPYRCTGENDGGIG